jgi:hypothetical protein
MTASETPVVAGLAAACLKNDKAEDWEFFGGLAGPSSTSLRQEAPPVRVSWGRMVTGGRQAANPESLKVGQHEDPSAAHEDFTDDGRMLGTLAAGTHNHKPLDCHVAQHRTAAFASSLNSINGAQVN